MQHQDHITRLRIQVRVSCQIFCKEGRGGDGTVRMLCARPRERVEIVFLAS